MNYGIGTTASSRSIRFNVVNSGASGVNSNLNLSTRGTAVGNIDQLNLND